MNNFTAFYCLKASANFPLCRINYVEIVAPDAFVYGIHEQCTYVTQNVRPLLPNCITQLYVLTHVSSPNGHVIRIEASDTGRH